MVAFAANSLLCRGALGVDRIDAITFTAVRIVSGAVALFGWALLRDRKVPSGSWVSAGALFGYAIAFSLAYTRIPTGVGALLLFGAVQITMIGYAIATGARLRPGERLGLVVALGGLVVLTRPGLEAPDVLGVALMTLAGVAWGVYTLRGQGQRDPLGVTAGNFALAVIPALGSLFLGHGVKIHWSQEGLVLAGTSGVLASGCGYAIWYTALPHLTATSAAIVQLSAPLLAAIGGVIILGETASLRLVVATPLLLGGIALAILTRRR
jgi:drug/metabolite transporter (DMT)-like permease